MDQSTIRSMTDRKKPSVKLAGEDGNAFAILGRTRKAMREVGWTKAEVSEFTDEAMSADYDELIRTVCKYCKVA